MNRIGITDTHSDDEYNVQFDIMARGRHMTFIERSPRDNDLPADRPAMTRDEWVSRAVAAAALRPAAGKRRGVIRRRSQPEDDTSAT